MNYINGLVGEQLIAFRIIYMFNFLYSLDILVNYFGLKINPKHAFICLTRSWLTVCLPVCVLYVNPHEISGARF